MVSAESFKKPLELAPQLVEEPQMDEETFLFTRG